MKIYLAARYSRFPEMQEHAKKLEALGHRVTSRWILGNHDIRVAGDGVAAVVMPVWAREDYEDLAEADVCLSFTEPPGDVPGRGRGGRHCEHGIALALGKVCMVVGYRENIFHWLEAVVFCATWEEALGQLRELADGKDQRENSHPDGTPCTCTPGTVGWSQHHGSMPGGPLSETFYAALCIETTPEKKEDTHGN